LFKILYAFQENQSRNKDGKKRGERKENLLCEERVKKYFHTAYGRVENIVPMSLFFVTDIESAT